MHVKHTLPMECASPGLAVNVAGEQAGQPKCWGLPMTGTCKHFCYSMHTDEELAGPGVKTGSSRVNAMTALLHGYFR